MSEKNGYVGNIGHGGSQVVKAPLPGDGKRGNGTVKTGDDLRGGKK
ncbi:MAG: hypothetical protein ACI4RV_00075 [Eubacteriales bacterium]